MFSLVIYFLLPFTVIRIEGFKNSRTWHKEIDAYDSVIAIPYYSGRRATFTKKFPLQVWDLRQIIKKGRERRVFLFDLHLLLAKEVKDSHGKAKYIYKTKFMVSFDTSNVVS